MVTISFPGLGIEPFTVNKVAFSIGSIEVRWYGLIIVTGIILAFAYASWRAKQEGIVFDDMIDMALVIVPMGIVCARLYYVLTTLDEYDSLYEMIAVWNGGLAIYGGIFGGILGIFIVSKWKKLKFTKALDCIAPGVMIGQLLGRWGNFFNGEAYGATPTEGSLFYFMRMGLQHEGWSKEYFYQPTFLYESLWNLTGFLIINAIYKKKKFDGQIVLMYLTWYGFGRMLIEGLRTDSLYVGPFRISQLIGFLCFAAGLGALIFFGIRAKKAALVATADGTLTESSFSALAEDMTADNEKTNESEDNGNDSQTD